MTTPHPVPTPAGELDRTVGYNVHTYLWLAGDTQRTVARGLGIDGSTLSRKLKGERPFLPVELQYIARRYDVSVDSLFSTVGPASPRRDSNSQPSDYKPASSTPVISLDRWRRTRTAVA